MGIGINRISSIDPDKYSTPNRASQSFTIEFEDPLSALVAAFRVQVHSEGILRGLEIKRYTSDLTLLEDEYPKITIEGFRRMTGDQEQDEVFTIGTLIKADTDEDTFHGMSWEFEGQPYISLGTKYQNKIRDSWDVVAWNEPYKKLEELREQLRYALLTSSSL